MSPAPLRHAAVFAALALLAACDKPETPAPSAAGAPSPAAASATPIKAPAGTYKLDPYHTTLEFEVLHVGLADYNARFTKYDATIEFDPANLEKSSVAVTIDPRSVRTDFSGDYKASHKESPYNTFDEALARDAKFFRADEFPQIEFKSTKVEAGRDGTLRVTGDLTFLGQTRPVTLEARVTGSMDKHPFTGRGALGFSATTKFNRSEWGMTGTQQFLGDTVTIEFDGEFGQAAPEEPAPKSAN